MSTLKENDIVKCKNACTPTSPSHKAEKKRQSRHKKRTLRECGKAIRFRCDFPSTQLKVMLARGWTQVSDGDESKWDLWWCDVNDVRAILESELTPQQKVPHFRNHYELTRKNYLYRNWKRYKKLLMKAGKTKEAAFCDSMPITFEFPNEYRMLVEEYHKQKGSTWIVKPSIGSQGKGIFLFRRLKDLVEWRAKESAIHEAENESGYGETFVVQKYIDDPYLLAGRKFDLRIYVLVTSFHPLKVWVAREGFARLSGELFSLERIDDRSIHLTNMAIQLRGKSPRRNDAEGPSTRSQVKRGCKWSLLRVREYLTARHGVAVVDTLLQRIAGVIMASLQAVQPVMIQGKNSFELYGYDVLLDKNLTPWLLEVNASPALAPTDPDDFRLKFQMLDDLLNVLDLERMLTGRETRVGGFDLLWNDGPVWITCPNPVPCGDTILECPESLRKLNIFLGARNDREEQLAHLRKSLRAGYRITSKHKLHS